ncbi:uncharacterized protein LOC119600983 [Lucilia sericata]|uniref:uncharacterized protein LOC119600983 n=1 Tax=Lucilia sericata TaxID=13632 RepID=UPI0018A858BC|nr:uncharacterized protein LOC119600983 [Lucilia sericata]
MHFSTGCIIILLGLFSSVMANDDCTVDCPLIYEPVCGTVKNLQGKSIKCTFGNECELKIFTCTTKQELIEANGECKEDFSECDALFDGL